MTKKILTLIAVTVLAVTLAISLSGCGQGGYELDGLNIVTFELEGGTLELKSSSVDTNINYAYEPGTYILDPSTIPGYTMYRQGYNFTGWYTSKECNPSEKWDFGTPFNDATLTLYAGWEKAIKITYTVYYVDGTTATALGQYDVKAGDSFRDWLEYADKRSGYTPIGYYSDMAFTTAWDDSFAHPGGDVDTDIAVYVDYIEGEWELVDSFAALKDAIKSGKNVYLTSDIDCGGEELVNRSLTTTYNGIFEGNGYTVSNFTVKSLGSLRPSIAIFKTLGKDAEIRNVSFTSVAYDLNGVKANVSNVSAAALAEDALSENGKCAKITNVSIVGALSTNYQGDLSRAENAVYNGEATVEVTGFTADITITIETNN